jgi:hypothetical protein
MLVSGNSSTPFACTRDAATLIIAWPFVNLERLPQYRSRYHIHHRQAFPLRLAYSGQVEEAGGLQLGDKGQ